MEATQYRSGVMARTTTYTIETGIPVPQKRRGKVPSPRGARTAWTRTIDALEVGQSVFTPEEKERSAAVQFAMKARPKEFTVRKIVGQGWRIWRMA